MYTISRLRHTLILYIYEINRDQNFYCFLRRAPGGVCHLFTQGTFNVFIRIPFVFCFFSSSRGVLRIICRDNTYTLTHIHTNINQGFKSSPLTLLDIVLSTPRARTLHNRMLCENQENPGKSN